jgi:hypothetical protein
VNAWHNSWNIARVNNLEELETLGRQPSAYWKIIMPKQVLPPSSLGIDFLFTEDQRSFYGFDLFNLDRFLSAGDQPDLLTVAQYSFEKAQIENALLASGYQAEKLETEDALYSIMDDYEVDLEFPMNTGKLGNLNRIFVYDGHMIVAKASTIVTNSLATYTGEIPSLGEDPAHIAAAMALENPELSETGELVGAVLMDGSQFGDTRYYLSHFVNRQVIQELRESTQEIQLPPFSLVAFATRHTEGASYLVLAVVFPEGTDAGDAAIILADRLQNYTSFFSGETFEEKWTFEKAVGIEANGLPVALVVMRVDDPPHADEDAAVVDSGLFTWNYLVSKGDVLFLVPEQPQE